jgi:rhodanese-related sulfurtransferase
MFSIDYKTLAERTTGENPFMLIDVRESFEHESYNIGGQNIPLGTLHTAEFPKDCDIILYCAKGIRSVIAAQKLEAKGYTRVYNLTGGLAAIPM